MLEGTSCQRRQLTVWVGMGERWGQSFPKHTLPSHSQPPCWRPRAWAVSPDVLHDLGFHLALRRRRTRGVFGRKQRFISIKSHRVRQIGKHCAKKRNKERNYLRCFWLWGLERAGEQDNTVCLTTTDRHQSHKERRKTTSLPNSTLLLFKTCPKAWMLRNQHYKPHIIICVTPYNPLF